MKKLIYKTAAGLLLLVSAALQAQTSQPINVVTTAVPFLRISPDARAGGMGETGLATSADANAPYWNLAKTSFNENSAGISATYTPWLKKLQVNDVYLASLAGYYKISDKQAIAASLRYFSLGNIQFTDNMGTELGAFRPSEFAFDAGYTRQLSEHLGLGIAMRYIHSNLAGGKQVNGTTYKAGSALAGDISLFYTSSAETGEGLNLGATLSNLGTKIGYTNNAAQKDFIPASLGLGAAYTHVPDEDNKITLALDMHKLMVPTTPAAGDSLALVNYRNKSSAGSWFSSFGDAPGGFSEELREWQLSAGLEYTYRQQFSLRGGYFYEDKLKGNRKYFTLGAGFTYNVLGLNLSYIIPSGNGLYQNPLSSTLRFSLLFKLGE